MDLQKHLDESGYTRAVEELAEFKRVRDMLAGRLLIATPEKAVEMQRDLDELNERIPKAEAALAAEYKSSVAYVDAQNDLEFQSLEITELAELVAEEFEKTDPAAAETARAIMRGDAPTKS